MSKDYYNTLGVDRSASPAEIKKAFHRLAHQHHPDKANGDEKKFKEANEAYQVLGNEERRKKYDQFGSAAFQGGAEGFSGFDSNNVNMDFGDLGDMFGNMGDIFGFGGRRASSTRNRRGSDIQTVLSLDFKEAAFGVEKDISLNKVIRCEHCEGRGAEPGAKIDTCGNCNGAGKVSRMQQTILGSIQTESVCQSCQGEGRTFSKKCIKCHGNGIIKDIVRLKIKIPAGINEGETVRLSGQGEAAPLGGQAGNLYIRVRINKDNNFVREGYDIRSKADLSISQASLGDKIDILTIDGNVKLKIPEGTQPGTIFRLRSKGIPKLQGRGRGDHLVEVKVRIPKTLNKAQKKALEDLGL